MLFIKSWPEKPTVAEAAGLPALDALKRLVALRLRTLEIDVQLPPHQVRCHDPDRHPFPRVRTRIRSVT